MKRSAAAVILAVILSIPTFTLSQEATDPIAPPVTATMRLAEAKALDMEPGTVSARRGDLMRDHRISEAPARKCDESGKMVKTWRPTQ